MWLAVAGSAQLSPTTAIPALLARTAALNLVVEYSQTSSRGDVDRARRPVAWRVHYDGTSSVPLASATLGEAICLVAGQALYQPPVRLAPRPYRPRKGAQL